MQRTITVVARRHRGRLVGVGANVVEPFVRVQTDRDVVVVGNAHGAGVGASNDGLPCQQEAGGDRSGTGAPLPPEGTHRL
jgi:hypothetical protein